MGVIGQILSIKVHGLESVHEKITQMIKNGKELLRVINEEEEIEKKLQIAEKEGNADEIFRLQKEELKLTTMALDDIKHILVELFALSGDERNEIDRFIIEGRKLVKGGIEPEQEKQIIDELQKQKNTISEFFASTRMTAGFER